MVTLGKEERKKRKTLGGKPQRKGFYGRNVEGRQNFSNYGYEGGNARN